jgi:hypothetical protein
MPDTVQDPVFVDTSILIGKVAHRPEIQESIRERLRQHNQIVSGLIVRQEFKRRLLKDAVYLLKQLTERKSFLKVRRHIQDSLLHPGQRARRQICLDLLSTVDESDTDDDLFDRARLTLRDLIKNGIATSEANLSRVDSRSGCACANHLIIEKARFVQYDLGGDRCSATEGRCGIKSFLEANRDRLAAIHAYLSSLPAPGKNSGKTKQLQNAEDFIARFLAGGREVESENPCLTVGDLLIALESAECATMYTMNVSDSRHLARVLRQSLIYRPPNSDNPEVTCLSSEENWDGLPSS